MANRKITDLPNLATPADADVVPFVDVSDTTESAQGTSVKVLWSNIKATLKTYFDTLYPSVSSLTGYLRSDIADTKTAGDLTFDDNVKIQLGTGGAESEIYSDATNTNINLKSGDLKIRNNGVDIIQVDRVNNKFKIINSPNIYASDGRLNDYFSIGTIALRLFNNSTETTTGTRFELNKPFNSAFNIGYHNGSVFTPSIVVNTSGRVSIRNSNDIYDFDVTGTGRFTGEVIVPADPYTIDWNGDNSVPTKNDVYDEMETKITGSSGTYTPTAVTDVTFYDAFYQIIGNQCSLRVNFEFSTLPVSTPTTFSLSLPSGVTVASPVLNRLIGAGHGYSEANNILEYRIKEQAGSSLLTVEIYSLEVGGSPSVMQFSITTTIEIN